MPTYDYRCTKCKHAFELFHSMSDETAKRCPKCKAKAVRVPSGGAGLLFKGSGFYITDYRSKSYQDKAKKDSGGDAAPSSSSGGDAAPSSSSGADSASSPAAGSAAGPAAGSKPPASPSARGSSAEAKSRKKGKAGSE